MVAIYDSNLYSKFHVQILSRIGDLEFYCFFRALTVAVVKKKVLNSVAFDHIEAHYLKFLELQTSFHHTKPFFKKRKPFKNRKILDIFKNKQSIALPTMNFDKSSAFIQLHCKLQAANSNPLKVIAEKTFLYHS